MQEKLELPAIFFLGDDFFLRILIEVRNLFECLMIESAALLLILAELKEKFGAAKEHEDVAEAELEVSSIRVLPARKLSWQLGVLNDVVSSILLANDANFLSCISLSTGFETCMKISLARKADLNRVEYLVEGVIDSNNLYELELGKLLLNLHVASDSLE